MFFFYLLNFFRQTLNSFHLSYFIYIALLIISDECFEAFNVVWWSHLMAFHRSTKNKIKHYKDHMSKDDSLKYFLTFLNYLGDFWRIFIRFVSLWNKYVLVAKLNLFASYWTDNQDSCSLSLDSNDKQYFFRLGV